MLNSVFCLNSAGGRKKKWSMGHSAERTAVIQDRQVPYISCSRVDLITSPLSGLSMCVLCFPLLFSLVMKGKEKHSFSARHNF